MTSKEALEKIISDKPVEVRAKAVVLFNGMAQSATAYQSDPTSANLKNWRAAEKELDAFLASIGPTEQTFQSVVAVVAYLKEQGWKISPRTGYNHKEKGHLRPRSDGKFYKSDVDEYAASGLLEKLDGTTPEASDTDTERKRKAEADTAEFMARIKKIQAEALEGKYIERDSFERALAQRAALFKNDIEAFIRGKAEDFVSVVGGESRRIPDLIEFMLEEFEKCLGRYAANIEFAVPDPTHFEERDPDDE